MTTMPAGIYGVDGLGAQECHARGVLIHRGGPGPVEIHRQMCADLDEDLVTLRDHSAAGETH